MTPDFKNLQNIFIYIKMECTVWAIVFQWKHQTNCVQRGQYLGSDTSLAGLYDWRHLFCSFKNTIPYLQSLTSSESTPFQPTQRHTIYPRYWMLHPMQSQALQFKPTKMDGLCTNTHDSAKVFEWTQNPCRNRFNKLSHMNNLPPRWAGDLRKWQGSWQSTVHRM